MGAAFSANSRAMTSTPPPAANGTMTLIVLSGNEPCWANAGAAESQTSDSMAASRLRSIACSPRSVPRLLHERSAAVFVDMHPDDLVERAFGDEAERGRALGLEAVRPAGDDAHDQFVGGRADARRDLVARDPAQRLDLLADRAAHAGHGQVDARLDLVARKPRGMNEEAHGRTRAGVGVHHRVG